MALVPLEQANPQLYRMWLQTQGQPQAQYQETQASTEAAGASAAASSAAAETTKAKLPVVNQDVQQAQEWGKVQQAFDKNKTKSGYVDPATYNQAKEHAASIGIDGPTFDAKFQSDYVDPNNVNYNTSDAVNARQQYMVTKKGLQSTLDQYNAIPEDQKGLFSKSAVAQIPLLGKILAPQAQEYEKQLAGLAAQLAPEAGAGSGSNVKVTQTELSNWAALMPSPNKTKEQNAIDIKQLNQRLEAKFGQGAGLDPQYLPDKNGNLSNQAGGPTAGKELLDFLTGDIQKGAKMVQNYPAALQQGAQEIQQKGALGAPSTNLLSKLTGGQLPQTDNRFLNAANAGYQSSAGAHGAAGEIGNILTAPAVTKDAIATGGNFIQNLLGNGVKEAAPALDSSVLDAGKNLMTEGQGIRNTAIDTAEKAGKTVDGTGIFNQIDDWSKSAKAVNPTKVQEINDMVKGAEQTFKGKVFTPSQAKSFWDEAKNGFTLSGKVGNTVESGFQRTVRDGVRNSLENVAPGFEEGTGKIAEGISQDKILSQVKASLQKAGLKAGLTPTPVQKTTLQKILTGAAKAGLGAMGFREISDVLSGK